MMAFCPEHPKWDQNPKFTPLSETTSIPTPFICGVPPTKGGLGQGRALGNNICFVEYETDSRNPEARTYRQIPSKILYEESSTEVQHLPFYIPLLTETIPLSRTFNWEMVTLSNTSVVHWIPFSCCKCTVLNMNTALNLPGSFLVFFTAIKCAC